MAQLGQHLFDQAVPQESLDLLTRATRVDAQSAPAERKRTRVMLAILQARKERFGPANTTWQEALALPPKGELDPNLLLELERAFVQGDQVEAAQGILKEIGSCCPTSPAAGQARMLLGLPGDAQ